MRLYEYEAKEVFRQWGMSTPKAYGVVASPEEFERLEVSYPVMLKAQVLIGGRGKAGGIKKAASHEEAQEILRSMFSMNIRGYRVEKVFVEEAVDSTGAIYMGVTMDPAVYRNVVMVSAEGGVDIETVAQEKPEAIHRYTVEDNAAELPGDVQTDLGKKLADDLNMPDLAQQLSEAVGRLYALYQQIDARVCEINPMLVADGGLMAADAKIVLDNNALFRHTDVLEKLGIHGKRHDVAEPTANERRAYASNIQYVDLLPEGAEKEEDKLYVGLVPGGAGYGIFSIDETANVGDRFFDGKVVPVNFMDSGGGPSQSKVAEMFHLLMDYPIVDIIITSRFGGISSCDVFIRGLVQALRERHADGRRVVPVYGRMVGTDLPSARAYLERAVAETPDALRDLKMVVGNQKIMAEVIKEAVEDAFRKRGWKS